jgi:hypothetical protein
VQCELHLNNLLDYDRGQRAVGRKANSVPVTSGVERRFILLCGMMLVGHRFDNRMLLAAA